MTLLKLLIPAAVAAIFLVTTATTSATAPQLTFNNPIHVRDFWEDTDLNIFHLNSYYYLITADEESGWERIKLYQSELLTNFRNATVRTYYPHPPTGEEVQLSLGKMHMLDGELYLYFTRFVVGGPQRMYGMRAKNSSDPMGEWEEPVQVATDWELEQGIFYGTVLKHAGSLYLVFARFIRPAHWNGIYIQKLVTPTETIGPAVMIKNATEGWECDNGCSTGAPYFIYNGEVSYMIFSVNRYDSENFGLTRMSIPVGKDPMDPGSWEHLGEPVFGRNEEEGVYTPGFASFTDSPDGTETWMMYQAGERPGRAMVTPRLEKIEWAPDGSPQFPRAHGYNRPQPVPSGQTYA